MSKIINEDMKNRMKKFIDEKLAFENDDEKKQFLEFVEPIFSHKMSDYEVEKLSRKNQAYFDQLIRKFKIGEAYFYDREYANNLKNRHVFLSIFGYFFVRKATAVYITAIILMLIFQQSLKLMSTFFVPCLVISIIWTLKGMYYFGDEPIREKIREKNIEAHNRKGYLAQILYCLNEYCHPISKTFIDTKKDEVKKHTSSMTSLENVFKSCLNSNNEFMPLNIEILTYNNQDNFNKLIQYGYNLFYFNRDPMQRSKDDMTKDEIVKNMLK